MPKPSKQKKQHTEAVLDQFVGALRGNGEKSVAILVRDVIGPENPSTGQVESAIKLFADDARFVLTEQGLESTVRMAGEGEPEDITAAATASSDRPAPSLTGEECRALADEANGIPPATGEAAPVATIGEALEQQESAAVVTKQVQQVEVVETVEAVASEDTATLARLKQVKAGIDAQANTIHHLSEDLKEHKKRLEVLEAERDQLIDGEIPPTQMGTKDPAQTPVGRAISGQAPMIVESPVEGMYRQQGATMAAQGKTELDCPYVRETNARGVSMWFDGFREAKREDHSEREVIVQALTREQLVEACLPTNGILLPGETTPKVAYVTWDKRATLVLDMLADGEGPTAGQERWSLLPTYDRDEWGNLFAETYGPAIADVDANDEARAKRIAGGINAGRLVKCGRSKRVVGPLSTLSVAIVKVESKDDSAEAPY